MEASTVFNFLSLDAQQSTAQTGDLNFAFIISATVILFVAMFVGVFFIRKKEMSPTLLTLVTMIALPLVISGYIFIGQNKAIAAGAYPVNEQIDVYINPAGGPVTYGEGNKSNIQTYTNTTSERVILHNFTMEGSQDIGHWIAVRNDTKEVLFDGKIGTTYDFKNAIPLDPGKSIDITWTTDTSSEELASLVGVVSPAKVKYISEVGNIWLVHFESNRQDVDIKEQIIQNGECAQEPEVKSVGSSVLLAWSENSETFIPAYDFTSPVYSDINLYGQWKSKEEAISEIETSVMQTQDFINNLVKQFNLSPEKAKDYMGRAEAEMNKAKDAISKAETGLDLKNSLESAKQAIFGILKEAAIQTAREDTDKSQETILDSTKVPGISSSDQEYFKDLLNANFTKTENDINEISYINPERENIINQSVQNNVDNNKTQLTLAKNLGSKKIEDKSIAIKKADEDIATIKTLSFFCEDNILAYSNKVKAELDSTSNSLDACHLIENLEAIVKDGTAKMNLVVDEAQKFNTIKENAYKEDAALNKTFSENLEMIGGLTKSDIDRYKNNANTKLSATRTNLINAKTEADVNAAQNTYKSNIDALLNEAQQLGSAKLAAYTTLEGVHTAYSKSLDALITNNTIQSWQKQEFMKSITDDEEIAKLAIGNETSANNVIILAQKFQKKWEKLPDIVKVTLATTETASSSISFGANDTEPSHKGISFLGVEKNKSLSFKVYSTIEQEVNVIFGETTKTFRGSTDGEPCTFEINEASTITADNHIKISGCVRDSISKEPCSGIRFYCADGDGETAGHAVSDDDGNYEMFVLPIEVSGSIVIEDSPYSYKVNEPFAYLFDSLKESETNYDFNITLITNLYGNGEDFSNIISGGGSYEEWKRYFPVFADGKKFDNVIFYDGNRDEIDAQEDGTFSMSYLASKGVTFYRYINPASGPTFKALRFSNDGDIGSSFLVPWENLFDSNEITTTAKQIPTLTDVVYEDGTLKDAIHEDETIVINSNSFDGYIRDLDGKPVSLLDVVEAYKLDYWYKSLASNFAYKDADGKNWVYVYEFDDSTKTWKPVVTEETADLICGMVMARNL